MIDENNHISLFDCTNYPPEELVEKYVVESLAASEKIRELDVDPDAQLRS